MIRSQTLGAKIVRVWMSMTARDWWHSTTKSVACMLNQVSNFESNAIWSQAIPGFFSIDLWLHENLSFGLCIFARDLFKNSYEGEEVRKR